MSLHPPQGGAQRIAEFCRPGESEELRKAVQRLVLFRKAVSLLVVDHLQPVLDAPQEPVVGGQGVGHRPIRPTGLGQHRQSVDGSCGAEAWIAAAEDELLRLSEELDLANAAAPEFQIVPVDGNDIVTAGIMNPPLYAVNILNRREIQRFAAK